MSNAIDKEIQEILGENFSKLKNIREVTEVRNSFLQDIMKGKFVQRLTPSTNTRLVITRKWSSWAPSFFDTIGGCYAFILPTKTKAANSEKGHVIVIDPGFKFLEALRPYGVDVSHIDSVIVSHFHPDHMAGLMELLTLIQESDHTVKLYLNGTTHSFFSQLGTKNAEFIELQDGSKIELSCRTLFNGSTERIYIEPRKAFHREMGARAHALSLIFNIEREADTKIFQERIAILGDTDGLEIYFEEYIRTLADANELILHLGTVSAEEYGKGYKHLYDVGLIKLLRRLKDEARRSKQFEKMKAIIISEFGLEMASSNYLREVVALYTPATKWQALLLFVSLSKKREDIKTSSEPDEKKKKQEKEIEFKIEVVAKTLLDLLTHDFSYQPSLSHEFLAEQAFLTYTVAFCLSYSRFSLAGDYWNRMQQKILYLLDNYPTTDEQGKAVYAPLQSDLIQHLVIETDSFVKIADHTVSTIICSLFRFVEVDRREIVSGILVNLADSIKDFSFWQLREAFDGARRVLRGVILYGRQETGSVLRRIEELFGRSEDWSLLQEAVDKNTQLALYGLLFSALLTKYVVALKENQFKGLDALEGFQRQEIEVFQQFLEIVQTLAPQDTNILIGDNGFVASFDFESGKFVTRVRVINTTGEFCWEDIKTVKCKETKSGGIQYLQG